MKMFQNLIWSISDKSRKKRAEVFRRNFVIDKTTKILDIGSENGENINFVLKGIDILPENVYIADINGIAIKEGRDKFGYQPIFMEKEGVLPSPNKFFDIVYCSSVIEHTTVPKIEIWNISANKKFKTVALENQNKFAREIIRVGKQYFVQTPAKYFPLESHTWLPMFAFLPRVMQLQIMTMTNKVWIKKAVPDFNLLTENEMANFFPDANIVLERKFGLAKSIMAIKTLR